MSESITIVVSWPDPALWQNRHTHWRQRNAATKAARRESAALFLAAGVPASCPWSKSRLSLCFHLPDNRARDECNMIGAMKAHIDGAIDAGVIAGDDWKRMRLGESKIMPHDPETEPGVVIHLERVVD